MRPVPEARVASKPRRPVSGLLDAAGGHRVGQGTGALGSGAAGGRARGSAARRGASPCWSSACAAGCPSAPPRRRPRPGSAHPRTLERALSTPRRWRAAAPPAQQGRRRGRLVDDAEDHLRDAAATEGGRARHHLVDDAAHREDVRAGVDLPGCGPGPAPGHVLRRADERRLLRLHRPGVEDLGGEVERSRPLPAPRRRSRWGRETLAGGVPVDDARAVRGLQRPEPICRVNSTPSVRAAGLRRDWRLSPRRNSSTERGAVVQGVASRAPRRDVEGVAQPRRQSPPRGGSGRRSPPSRWSPPRSTFTATCLPGSRRCWARYTEPMPPRPRMGNDLVGVAKDRIDGQVAV